MSKKQISSFEKIGYLKKLPKNADINNYEIIHLKHKNGLDIKLYRKLKKFDINENTLDFKRSWQVFNNYL